MTEVSPVNKAICLEWLCESNFQKLITLIPGLLTAKTTLVGKSKKKPKLYLKIIDRSPYTLTVILSHHFEVDNNSEVKPDIKIRIYKDAQIAEVIADCDRDQVFKVISDPGRTKEILDYKWRQNYFLQKWLNHCLQMNYQFNIQSLNEAFA